MNGRVSDQRKLYVVWRQWRSEVGCEVTSAVTHWLLFDLSNLCADFIMSEAARQSILVSGGGAPPVQKNRRRSGVIEFMPKYFNLILVSQVPVTHSHYNYYPTIFY